MTAQLTNSRYPHAPRQKHSAGGGEQRRQWFFACSLFVVALGIVVFTRWQESVPPEPNFSGYYDGPWVNKRGQLVAPDGAILDSAFGQKVQDAHQHTYSDL